MGEKRHNYLIYYEYLARFAPAVDKMHWRVTYKQNMLLGSGVLTV